jgi:hypothetical protein
MAAKTIDPRKLARLAAAARKLGMSRLRVGADGSAEFDLAPLPGETRPDAAAPAVPAAAPAATIPAVGSEAWLRNRFARKN